MEHPIVIIVLNHNKKNDLLECLDSIGKQDYKKLEIIVVDNASTDDSAAAIKKFYSNIHLIESKKNTGVAGGRNSGINYANEKLNYKFILFLDNDVVLDKHALSEMIKSFEIDKSIGIVTPKCYMMNSPSTIGYAGGMSVNLFTGKITDVGNGEEDKGQFDHSKFISSTGGLCLISRELIDKVGLFDERFNPYGWEDVDYSIRTRKKGFKIFYNYKAIIHHKGGKSGRGIISEYEFSKVKNYFYLMRKHTNYFQFLIFTFVFPFKVLFVFFKELYRGEFKTLFSQAHGFFSLLKKMISNKNFQISSPVISVIIPFYGYRKDLKNCFLKGLQKQEFNYPFEVIVLESGNDQEVKQLINSEPNFILISSNSLMYPGKARNLGVRNCKSNLLAFIDADCVPSPGWLIKIFSFLKDGNEIVIGPIINLYPFHPIASVDNLLQFLDFQKRRPLNKISHFPACNLGITKELFIKTGGFPEHVETGEDVKFSESAIRLCKGKIIFNSQIIMYHSGRKNFTGFMKHNEILGFHRDI